MDRRRFVLGAGGLASATGLAAGLAVDLCLCGNANAALVDSSRRRSEIDAEVQQALRRFYAKVPAAREVEGRALGMLVFPRVGAAAWFVGGEFGEGALVVGGRSSGYYSVSISSLGPDTGGQAETVILMIMTRKAMTRFRKSKSWMPGADLAVARIGANGELNPEAVRAAVIGFVLNDAGLIPVRSLAGSKVARLDL